MVARSRPGSNAFQWTTLLYLLLILLFPLLLIGTVHAQGSSASNTSREDLGDGKLADFICGICEPADSRPVIGIDLGMFKKVTT